MLHLRNAFHRATSPVLKFPRNKGVPHVSKNASKSFEKRHHPLELISVPTIFYMARFVDSLVAKADIKLFLTKI